MTRRTRVLLVDDDGDDRLLFAKALYKSGLDVDYLELSNGSAPVDHLLGTGEYADRTRFPFPDLVVLDLKMPGVDGFDVLKEIRMNMALQNLPVIVLTNSDSRKDTVAAYSLHANAVHHKPFQHDDLVRLLQTVIPLWLNFSSVPFLPKSTENKRIRPFFD
jgi:two-component system response regulator